MTTPVVTVLMSVYNPGLLVAEAIESVLAQTYANFQLAIIDDGSTDGSWSTISEYAALDQRVQPLRTPVNLGTSRALNLGLKQATGMYITRQDGDDRCAPERLARQVEFLQENPQIGAVGTSATLFTGHDTQVGLMRPPLENGEIQSVLLDKMCFMGPSLMVRRSAFCEAGLYFDDELSYSEDYDLCLRLAEVTKLANLAEPLYWYRQHNDSVSYRHKSRQRARAALALERAIQRRYGPTPSAAQFRSPASMYFRAAVLAFASQEYAEAQGYVSHAQELDPSLLESVDLVENTVRRYTPSQSVDEAIRFTEAIFRELLPQSSALRRCKANLLSNLHMGEVFRNSGQNQLNRIDGHLWQGVRTKPSWLLNRGVAALLVKRTLTRYFG